MNPLLLAILAVVLLLLLITVGRLNAFLAFSVVCLSVGLASGLPLEDTVEAFKKGIGETLGLLVPILGFGAMLGKVIADSGAARRITRGLVDRFGDKRIHWALMLTGLIVGIPMFYSVGFVILIPLVFTVAASTGLPLLRVGLPMLASLSVTHGFLPPHPAPTAIAGMFGADMGRTLFLGLLVALPAIVLAGPVLSIRLQRVRATPLKAFTGNDTRENQNPPGMGRSLLAALMPVLLMGLSALGDLILEPGTGAFTVIHGLGNPVLAMLLALFFAVFALGLRNGRKMKDLMEDLTAAVSSIAMILLIIAGAGALKEVLVASGISAYLGDLLQHAGASPLLLAWLIAAVIRIAVGSATVAGMTAAGIVLPLVQGPGVSPELMVLAIGAGSLMLSHVNDGGFWLFKEYFNLSVKDTLRTWTLMESAISVCGLVCVLILNIFM
ncbi:MAG: gluconate:H+ symporter [Bacteroidales bacterium]